MRQNDFNYFGALKALNKDVERLARSYHLFHKWQANAAINGECPKFAPAEPLERALAGFAAAIGQACEIIHQPGVLPDDERQRLWRDIYYSNFGTGPTSYYLRQYNHQEQRIFRTLTGKTTHQKRPPLNGKHTQQELRFTGNGPFNDLDFVQWLRLADIPEQQFEAILNQLRETPEGATTEAVLQLAGVRPARDFILDWLGLLAGEGSRCEKMAKLTERKFNEFEAQVSTFRGNLGLSPALHYWDTPNYSQIARGQELAN